jgi:hypothetical protein
MATELPRNSVGLPPRLSTLLEEVDDDEGAGVKYGPKAAAGRPLTRNTNRVRISYTSVSGSIVSIGSTITSPSTAHEYVLRFRRGGSGIGRRRGGGVFSDVCGDLRSRCNSARYLSSLCEAIANDSEKKLNVYVLLCWILPRSVPEGEARKAFWVAKVSISFSPLPFPCFSHVPLDD